MKLTVEDVKSISLKAGETLVVRVQFDQMSNENLTWFSDSFKKVFPNNQILLIPDTMEIYKVISQREDRKYGRF